MYNCISISISLEFQHILYPYWELIDKIRIKLINVKHFVIINLQRCASLQFQLFLVNALHTLCRMNISAIDNDDKFVSLKMSSSQAKFAGDRASAVVIV